MVRWSSLVAVALAAVGFFFAGSARAGTNCADLGTACNGAAIFAGSGTESCTLEASAQCMADCTPPNLQIACTGQLEAGCMGQCQATPPSVSCTGTCGGTCMANCSANPGNFSCEGSCTADCSGNCTSVCMGQCASQGSSTTCMGDCTAQCKASCGARCHGSCTGTPPSASCSAQCMASCNGECSVTPATLNCDVSCHAKGYVNCTSMLTGGCQANCMGKGALFCNGQFVNVNGSQLDNCANALECEFNIKVSGYANASGSCDGGTCSAQAAAGASASCDMSPNAPPISGGLMALGLAGLAAGVVRRRLRAASARR